MFTRFLLPALLACCFVGFASAQELATTPPEPANADAVVTENDQPIQDGEIVYESTGGCYDDSCYDPCCRPFARRPLFGRLFSRCCPPACPPACPEPYYNPCPPRPYCPPACPTPFYGPRPCFARPCFAPCYGPVYCAPVVYTPVFVRPYYYGCCF